MDVYKLIKARRTIRKYQRRSVDYELLYKFIDIARFSPSGMNMQPIRYMIVQGEKADKVFPHTHWAGLLKGTHSPSVEERPDSYILFLVPRGKSPKHDVGAVAQSMGLMAQAEGLGTCWMGAIDRKQITDICSVPAEYEIDTLMAFGYPAEMPLVCDALDGDTRYFVDEEDLFFVPKIKTDDLIF